MNVLRMGLRRVLRPWRADPVERLRALGMQIGSRLSLQPGVVFDESHAWLICIGDDVTLAPRVVVLAHDASTKRRLGYTRVGKVCIGHRVFIGGNTVILPGVHIGDDAIVGAGSVVSADIPAGQVAAGNPARMLMSTQAYFDKRSAQLGRGPCFGVEYTLAGGVDAARRRDMVGSMCERFGFVE
jgi:maltose O-acetyltransferase